MNSKSVDRAVELMLDEYEAERDVGVIFVKDEEPGEWVAKLVSSFTPSEVYSPPIIPYADLREADVIVEDGEDLA